MQNLKDFLTEADILSEITPFVRHVNKIIINEGETHCCPLRKLYDYQLVGMIKGELKFKIDDSDIILSSGDCVLLPPFVSILEYIDDNAEDLCLYFIVHFDFFFEKKRKDWEIEDMDLKYCRPWIEKVEPDPRYVDETGKNAHVLKNYALFEGMLSDDMLGDLQKMLNFYRCGYSRGRSESEDLILRAYMLKILARFCGQPDKEGVYRDAVNRFIDYASVNYRLKIDLNEVVKDYGYTMNYYRKIFKEETGVTPVEYLLDIRIEKAKDLLLHNFAVNEVANKVGFPDPYYFSKVFKKKTGVSPKDYKRTIQTNIN